MEFTSEGGLRAHSSHHKEEEMKFKCKECGKVFGWDHELTVSNKGSNGNIISLGIASTKIYFPFDLSRSIFI